MTKGRVVRNNGSNSTNTHHYRQNNKPHINDCFNPDLKKSITPGALIPTSVAVSKPCLNAVFPSGNASVRALSGTSLAYSSGILFKGQILGIMTAATRQDTITDK